MNLSRVKNKACGFYLGAIRFWPTPIVKLFRRG
jgi:hypothetical protein